MIAKEHKLYHLLASLIEDNEYMGEKVHAYYCNGEYDPSCIRVDYNRESTFEVTKFEDDELYDPSNDRWEVVEKEWYMFRDCHEHEDELEPITIDRALEIVKEMKK